MLKPNVENRGGGKDNNDRKAATMLLPVVRLMVTKHPDLVITVFLILVSMYGKNMVRILRRKNYLPDYHSSLVYV